MIAKPVPPYRLRSLPDDAPASMFAPAPVAPYRRGFEDARYDHCWFCPYRAGTAEAAEYAAGWQAGRDVHYR